MIALREVVPSATAPLTLTGSGAGRSVRVVTVLPLAWSALVRRDGEILLALQTPQRSGDLQLDLGQALAAATDAEPGHAVSGLPIPSSSGPRFDDLVAAEPLEVTVHQDFSWWLDDDSLADATDEVRESMEQANESIVPTTKLASVPSAYWCRMGQRTHLRWALTENEDALLDAFARLHVAGALGLGSGTKYVGAFRALGILVPVWDLAEDSSGASTEEPAVAFAGRLAEALAASTPLSPEERRARAGVVGRQVTLR